MKAEILSVGTEILLGDIVNTNAEYLSKRLADLGIFVYYQTVVGDNPDRMKEAYELAFSRADLVLTTGGLGPTQDDLTKEIAAEYFNKKLVLDQVSLNRIKERFANLNREMGKSNIKQAEMPEACIILENNNGTAPGCIIEENNKVMVLMPGPPKEMKAMFEESVVPYLEKFVEGKLVSKVIRFAGIGESAMAEKLGDIITGGVNPTVAPYAKEFECIVRVTAKGKDEAEAKALIIPVEEEIRNRMGNYVYGTGEATLDLVVAAELVKRNLTIATAESCTGGLLAGTIINYPSISAAFLEGAVTYTNEAKVKRLGVKEATLEKFGAVSFETAGEMAKGIAEAAGTDIGISTTGIAGPGGGTDEKPVGLVYLGLSIKGKVKTKELRLNGNRDSVRRRAVREALNWLRLELLEIK